MLPKIGDALAQFIKPITSNAESNRPQLFKRFSSPQKDQAPKDENTAEEPAPDNVVPIRPETSIQQSPPHLTSGLPLTHLWMSLSDSRKLLLGIGRRLYARMRLENNKRKARKGIILDIKS